MHHAQQHQQPHAWANEMEQFTGKGKGRAAPPPAQMQQEFQQPTYQPQGYQPYSTLGGGMEYGGAAPYILQNPYRPPMQESARVVPLQEGEQTDLDAAFDKAMKEEEERLAAEQKGKGGEAQETKPENGSGMGDFEA